MPNANPAPLAIPRCFSLQYRKASPCSYDREDSFQHLGTVRKFAQLKGSALPAISENRRRTLPIAMPAGLDRGRDLRDLSRRAELTERETSRRLPMISPFVVHWNSLESNSSAKTAEAPVYGYAKRPRERAANRLSRPDTQLAKRIQFFAVALGQPVGAVGVHRRKRRRPGRAFEKDNERKRPQVTLRQPHLAKRSQIPQ